VAQGPEATPTAVATASPAPTGTVDAGPRVFDSLTNGGFEDGLYGWRDVGADVDLVAGLDGSSGAARVDSSSTSTKYLYQTVRVTPGAWYAGSATLRLGPGVDAAWMRVAWYASEDGSGTQLETGDSSALTGIEGTTGAVALGPLQAPFEAHSAQVRIMLRPLGPALAQLTVDAVRFGETAAPPPTAAPQTPAITTTAGGVGGGRQPPAGAGGPVTSDPMPSPGASRLVAGRPVDEDGAAVSNGTGNGGSGGGAESASRTGGGAAAEAGVSLDGFAPEIMLRITELLPDSQEPGNDADFEWVEVTNVGTEAIPLAGIELRDNKGVVALPDLVLQPGVSLVLAGPRAVVPEASAFRPAGGLSNGLGNSGDRLALIAPDGRIIDALSYGSDTTYDNPPLPAPGAGRSLRRYFGDDGTYAGFEVSDTPSPGRIEPPSAQLQATPGVSTSGGTTISFESEGDGSSRTSWIVLAGLGTAALAALGGQRLRELRRRN
jgi:hypothetical protein